ncbi:hypothetical protein QBC40DRAFT_83809 [Triangularia verruculosa]|uniref:Uncharacterized protein n=1 Tax=Triangularia verruculosa TaxID=2587418 RepID=A0AAN6XUC4_9PEZI|nr:hypothetical protein QBC40DRAFT_83809 [Triangularia verruculosa]
MNFNGGHLVHLYIVSIPLLRFGGGGYEGSFYCSQTTTIHCALRRREVCLQAWRFHFYHFCIPIYTNQTLLFFLFLAVFPSNQQPIFIPHVKLSSSPLQMLTTLYPYITFKQTNEGNLRRENGGREEEEKQQRWEGAERERKQGGGKERV